jgi:DNA-binding protein Fis
MCCPRKLLVSKRARVQRTAAPEVRRTIREAVHQALTQEPNIGLELRASLGAQPLHILEETVRNTLVREALAKTEGNITLAAKLLGISRQLLNHIRSRGE